MQVQRPRFDQMFTAVKLDHAHLDDDTEIVWFLSIRLIAIFVDFVVKLINEIKIKGLLNLKRNI